jgi:hypothetical protein
MAHNHSNEGNEYQIRIVHGDGTEELSEWMNSTDQVAQALAEVHITQGKAYWLLERNVLCPECLDREHGLEFPIMDIPSPRCMPHDSYYLLMSLSRNRSALSFSASWHTL